MPKSLLVKRTAITRARYPVIDFHFHGRTLKTADDYQALVRTMDQTGLGAIANMDDRAWQARVVCDHSVTSREFGGAPLQIEPSTNALTDSRVTACGRCASIIPNFPNRLRISRIRVCG